MTLDLYKKPSTSKDADAMQTVLADKGIVTDCGSAKVELAVASKSAFRVSVSFDGTPKALDTPMVDLDQPSFAKWTTVTDGEYTGIKTS